MKKTETIWKKIPNYSLYEASTDGDIKTFNWKNKGTEAIMKPAKDTRGYLRTMLKNESGKFCTIKVHRIIAQTFIENPLNKATVNHKNGIKDDNRVCNLEWMTQIENTKHANDFLPKNINKGEKVGTAILTEIQAQEILDNYEFGGSRVKKMSKKDLALKYGVSVSVIKSIAMRVSWRHLIPNNPLFLSSGIKDKEYKKKYREKIRLQKDINI
jgi:hypothetical protein